MYSLKRNEYSNLKLAGTTMGRGLGWNEEVIEMNQFGYNTHIHGNNTRNLPVYSYLYLKLEKNAIFFLLSLTFFLFQN
jgi:hypothetical protein